MTVIQSQTNGGGLSLEEVIAPSAAQEGSTITATATIQNNSDECAEFVINWSFDGDHAGSETAEGAFCHPSGDTLDYTIDLGPLPGGSTQVCATVENVVIGSESGDVHEGCTETFGEAQFDPSSVSVQCSGVDSQTVQGENATVTLDITNANVDAAIIPIQVLADESVIRETTIEVPGDTVDTFTVGAGSGLSPGDYSIGVSVGDIGEAAVASRRSAYR